MRNLPKHLTETAQKALLLSTEDRIRHARRPFFIEYTIAKAILEKLEDLFNYPKMDRMPNLLIKGDTNNGKTMIVKKFRKEHPPCDNEQGEAINYPVLVVSSPPVPDEGRLYNEILEEIHAPYREKDSVDKKFFQVVRLLEQIGTKILIIDEIHDLLCGTSRRQQQVLNAIKKLGGRLKIPIVAVGTSSASNVFQCDPQLANRFEPVTLPKWTIDHQKGKDEFLELLRHFEMVLPLWNCSNLAKDDLVVKLHSMSEGLIGELFSVLSKACVEAIKKKKECITVEILESLNWKTPSQRKAS